MPRIHFRTQQEGWVVTCFVSHFRTCVYVESHVVVLESWSMAMQWSCQGYLPTNSKYKALITLCLPTQRNTENQGTTSNFCLFKCNHSFTMQHVNTPSTLHILSEVFWIITLHVLSKTILCFGLLFLQNTRSFFTNEMTLNSRQFCTANRLLWESKISFGLQNS